MDMVTYDCNCRFRALLEHLPNESLFWSHNKICNYLNMKRLNILYIQIKLNKGGQWGVSERKKISCALTSLWARSVGFPSLKSAPPPQFQSFDAPRTILSERGTISLTLELQTSIDLWSKRNKIGLKKQENPIKSVDNSADFWWISDIRIRGF